MPYSAEISRINPSCLIFLVDQSGSMSAPMPGTAGRTKAQAVADAINRLLDNLRIKCSKSLGILDYFDVGVIGYGANVGSAFGGALKGRDLVKISEVATNPEKIEDRVRSVEDGIGGLVEQTVKFPQWFSPVANGNTPMCQALGLVHGLLSNWVPGHASSYPPIVINITDGEATDGNPEPQAEAIRNLSTNDGNTLLYNCHVSSTPGNAVLYPSNPAGLPDQFAELLFRMSSTLPDPILAAATNEKLNVAVGARGFVFNAEMVDLIRFLDIGTRR